MQIQLNLEQFYIKKMLLKGIVPDENILIFYDVGCDEQSLQISSSSEH